MSKLKPFLKSLLPHLGVLVFFFVVVLIYFYPAFEGKVLHQGDVDKYNGMAQELVEYGKPSGWTGSMFSGMPAYQITGYSHGTDFVGMLRSFAGSLCNEYAGPMLILLITSYIMFLVLGARPWLSAIGAIAIAFSSYNIIIIEAGHVTKLWTLAFTPLVLAGMFAVFKKQYLSGLALFGLGLGLQIVSNHLQITYYTALFCGIMFIAFLADSIAKKSYQDFFKTSGILLACVILAVGSNLISMYINYEMGQESIRGKAQLTPLESNAAPVSSGLDKDYAFAWSYGKAETLTLLIPNAMGGASGGTLDKDSHLYKELKAKGAQVGNEIQTYTYWGDQPFTSGPIYFGAVVCFLFVFAFFVISNPYKWWLLGATIFFIMLSWGKNLAWFNDFMFYYLPYYNKFRTVSMALVIPGFTFPILAVIALIEITKGELLKENIKKALIYSLSITGGICFIFWLIPGILFNFQSPMDMQTEMPDWYLAALIKDRQGLMQADAFRSLIFILISGGLIFRLLKAKDIKKAAIYVVAGFAILVLCDMWQIDKRYLNADNFISKKTQQDQSFKKTIANEKILEDKSLSYRVFNLNNPFAETQTSYYHKSIGGYHAAKLRRYQDLVERRLSKELDMIIKAFGTATALESIMPILQKTTSLNMLNAKYIIYSPEQPPLENPYHYGNAWFVNSYKLADNADQEIAALETLNPRTEAILDKSFANNLNGLQIEPDSTAKIELTAYYPDKLEYKSSSQKQGLAILSEVYYPHGWKAFIDGKQVPISRADWTLRAIVVPAGDHQIQLIFDPEEAKTCGVIATIMSGILVFMSLGILIFCIYRKLK